METVYVRFYPEPESYSVKLDEHDSFNALLTKVYEGTNLEQTDKLKVSYKGIPINDYEILLSDYEVKKKTPL